METIGIIQEDDCEIDKDIENINNPILGIMSLDKKERKKYEIQYLFTKKSKTLFHTIISSQVIKATRSMFMIKISEIFKFPNFLKYTNHAEINNAVNLVCEDFGFRDFSYHITEDMKFVLKYKGVKNRWKKQSFFQIKNNKEIEDKIHTFVFYITQNSSYDILYVINLIFLNSKLIHDYYKNIDSLMSYNRDLRRELNEYIFSISQKLKEYEFYLKNLNDLKE